MCVDPQEIIGDGTGGRRDLEVVLHLALIGADVRGHIDAATVLRHKILINPVIIVGNHLGVRNGLDLNRLRLRSRLSLRLRFHLLFRRRSRHGGSPASCKCDWNARRSNEC